MTSDDNITHLNMEMPRRMLTRGAATEASHLGKARSRDAFRPLCPQGAIVIELSGASNGIRFSKTVRSTAMQPCVAEKFGRAMCKNMALPAPGITGFML